MGKRRTHCPDGRPLYRRGELPGDRLATRTMLAQRRRRLAEGQEPVASYLAGRAYVPLYEIAASVPLPEQTPQQRQRWVAARTCARCAATSGVPTPLRAGGRRLCARCDWMEHQAAVRPSHLALRLAATAWAADMLADPDAVILTARLEAYAWPLELHAATLAGQVLVDVTVRATSGPGRLYYAPGVIDPAGVVPALTPLVGRRAVWALTGRGHGWADHVTPLSLAADYLPTSQWWDRDVLAGRTIREDGDDGYRQRWRDWLCQPAGNWPSSGRPGLLWQSVGADSARGLAATVRSGLAAMAADEHPDGPATCPALPPTGLEPCGAAPLAADGACPGSHSLVDLGEEPSGA